MGNAYIGMEPQNPFYQEVRTKYVASNGQTLFTGLTYKPGYIDVYVNGSKLVEGVDFTALNGNSVTLTTALNNNDDVEIQTRVPTQIVDVLNHETGVPRAELASTSEGKGASLVGYRGDEDVKEALDARLPEVGSYVALRTGAAGAATAVYVRGVSNIFDGGHGVFRLDTSDTTSADNGGTIIVDAGGRRWKRDIGGVIESKWFGAKGDGSADDYPPMQAAAVAAAGRALHISGGVYKTTSGSVRIYSGTTVFGDGAGVTVIYQPNYYTYNRPTEAYVAANVVDWNGFWMECGTENVEIFGLSVRGPFYRSDGDYTTYPVENWPANNGIHVRGRDYQVRKSLPKTGVSSNIRIHDTTVEGFAEDAIQLDNVTNAWVTECNLNRCGRGGVRVYGGLRNWIENNTISYLSPGDYLNGRISGGVYIGGNRMYGVTFTRVYSGDLSIYRASEWCSARGNKVRNIPYWKGLDTHGGKHIEFIGNQIQECHIGIGIDKGGFDVSDGIAPPRSITIAGNEIVRTFADNPLEGDDGKCGPAITLFAHEATDDQIGKDIIVEGNQIDGHGPDDSWGAIVYQNWRGVLHRGNLIKNSRRAAVCIRSEFEGSIDGDYIDNVRATSGLDADGNPLTVVQNGIAVEGADCRGRIGDTVFINRESGTLRAMSLATPTSGYGFTLSAGHRYMNLGAGSITRVNLPGNDQLGPNQMRLRASGKVQFDGSISGQRGIASVTKTATGTYEVTLSEPCVAASSMWPVVSARASSVPIAAAESTSESVITVYMKNTSNALADGGFMISVFGY